MTTRWLCAVLRHRPIPVIERAAFDVKGKRKRQVRAVIVDWRCARCRTQTKPGKVWEAS